jgi:hypothetical protein
MRSPALAIAWEFRQRHRWGLIAVTGYLLVLATIKLLILEPGQPVNFDDESFALAVAVPLTATFMYFLAVFSFGLAGDLGARQSMYPTRMFTLPVPTAALAGWPMLYGTAAMAILWLVTRLFAVWPSGVDVPMVWPGLLAASLLAWTQALTWTPYPLRGLRVIVTVLWLAVIDAVVMVALEYKAPEPVMLAILAPHVPLAYFAARFAVGAGGSWTSSRNGKIHFRRPRALKRGSSGGCMAGRCRRWWGSCCRSSWPCFSSSAKHQSSSSKHFSACCSLHHSWPRSSLRPSASRMQEASPMA